MFFIMWDQFLISIITPVDLFAIELNLAAQCNGQ